MTEEHLYSTLDLGDRWQFACSCGFETYAWEKRRRRMVDADPHGCPQDPAVRSLVTLQFSWGGLFDGSPADGYTVHLIRSTNRGTPGSTLCGIDRFAKDAPGWSVGGGMTGRNVHHVACAGCTETARAEYPELPITGSVGAQAIRDALAAKEATA